MKVLFHWHFMSIYSGFIFNLPLYIDYFSAKIPIWDALYHIDTAADEFVSYSPPLY